MIKYNLSILLFIVLGQLLLNSAGIFDNVSIWILYPFLFLSGWIGVDVAKALHKINGGK